MALQKFEILSRIDSTTYDWHCRLRAQRIWKGINRETQQCWGINILFLDDGNNRIHAFISSKHADKLTEDLLEGKIYKLSNFKVKKYVGHETYRVVRTDKHIYFTEHTKCVIDSGPGLGIEPYAFDLFALEEIEKCGDDNRFLIDVVGIVQNVSQIVTTIKNNHETRRLMFEITDGRTFVKVTLFNEVCDAYAEKLVEKNNHKVVIIMASANIHKFDGRVNLTNFPPTMIYINPNHYSVGELMNSYNTRPVLDISSDEEEDMLINLTLNQLQGLGNDYLHKNVALPITIKKLDEKSSWYFARCAKCNVEVFKEVGRYKCSICKRIIPHPDKRFRVFTYCSDNSACVGIVLQDAEIRKYINKSVFDIHAEYQEEPKEEPFPDILKQLQHKDYTVIIKLNEDNIKNASTVYDAVGLNNASEISANYSPAKATETGDEMSLGQVEGATLHLNQTPETAKSTTIKRRVRKILNSQMLGGDNNGPQKIHKIIKTEKE